MWWTVAAAWAGVSGTVDGKPFEAKSAMAEPGNFPGTVQVILLDVDVACGSKPSGKPTALLLSFDAVAGAAASQGMVISAKTPMAMGETQATLLSMPGKVGDVGKLKVAQVTTGNAKLSGEMDFTLCTAVPPKVAPAPTFVAKTLTFEDSSGKLVLNATVPEGWATAQDFRDVTVYTGPDKITNFSIDATCAGGCSQDAWASNAKDYGAGQISGFKGSPGYVSEVYLDASPREGAWVARYGYGMGKISVVKQDVLLWGPDWPNMALCHTETLAEYTAFLDQAKAACLAITRVP